MQSYSLIAMYGFTAFVFMILSARPLSGLTLGKINIPQIKWIEHTSRLDAFFLFSGIVFIWIARLPILQFGLALNPDEAQLSANAMRIWAGGMNWDNLDPTSSGPLNSAVLAWPCLLGFDVTLTTTRMMGTAIISIMLVMLFLSIRRLAGTEIAVLSSFPLFVFYASTSTREFVHYSSEQLSLLLISVGIYGFFRIIGNHPDKEGKQGSLILSACSLGLVPFAKLQASPLAALVGLALIAAVLFRFDEEKRKLKIVSLVVCAAIAPSIMFLLPLLIRGEFHHFVNSYILLAKYYVGKPLGLDEFFRLVRSNGFYWDVCCSYTAVFVVSLVLFCFSPNTIATAQKWAVGIAVLAVLAAWFCVVRSGKPFEHYLHFMLPSLELSAGVLYAIGSDALLARMRSVRLQGVMHILVCLVVMASIIPAGKMEIKNNLANIPWFFRDGLTFKSPRLLQWMDTKKTDSILIWGWMPQWYMSTGMTPATRETHTQFVTPLPDEDQAFIYILWPHHLAAYFKDRLMQDFNNSHPDFILDAVTPDSFYFNNSGTQSISSFSNLNDIIKDLFIKVSSDDPNGLCPRLYVRKERFAEILRNLVPISRISASGQYSRIYGPEHVDDGNVFEFSSLANKPNDLSAGYWLLPDASTGHITLEFDSSRVGKVSILNTRHGINSNRASERVRILVLLSDKVLHQHELQLNRYPFWTNYILPEPVVIADRVRIEILSFLGRGAGLNEIKVYRE